MAGKLRVGVLFGGKSGEHDVSLLSASSVISAIDLNRYEVMPIGIKKNGLWKLGHEALQMLTGNINEDRYDAIASQLPAINHQSSDVLPLIDLKKIDVVFPVLHGTYGEDGTLQGFFDIVDIPYVGAGVLSSAVGMDKIFSKKVFQHAGLPQAEYLDIHRTEIEKNEVDVIDRIEKRLGYPCFVKPSNLGSSVGISKANNREELQKALQLATKYDVKIIIEEYVLAREIEVAVLGNHEPRASVPGEIIFSNDFYDYKAKYVDGKSIIQIPADLSEEVTEEIRAMAIEAFRAVDGSGLSRVDFFICKENGKILINEINTMPGFTSFSMYAKLWDYSGLNYSELVIRLIELALERHREKKSLVTTYGIE